MPLSCEQKIKGFQLYKAYFVFVILWGIVIFPFVFV